MESDTDQARHAGSRVEPGAPRSPYFRVRDLSLIGVFAALIAAFGVMPAIPIGGIGVPITLQTLAIVLTGLILGPVRGFAATALYCVVGLAGLPIFANFSGGPGVLAGPSGGYVVGFPFVALAAGALALLAVRKTTRTLRLVLLAVAGLAGGVIVGHAFGIAGMMVNLHLSVAAAAGADAVFIPGDVVKVVIAAFIAASVHRAFPDLLRRV